MTRKRFLATVCGLNFIDDALESIRYPRSGLYAKGVIWTVEMASHLRNALQVLAGANLSLRPQKALGSFSLFALEFR